MNKLYISGPMTGLPDYNFPAFHAAAKKLRGWGFEVVNPAENFGGDQTRLRVEYMKSDIEQILGCNAIAFLPGWRESKGSILEARVAAACGLSAYRYLHEPPSGLGNLKPFDLEAEIKLLDAKPTVRVQHSPYCPPGDIYLMTEGPRGMAEDLETALKSQMCGTATAQLSLASNGKIRQFASGATRNVDEGKPDYEGFLSPSVLIRYGEYMNKNRVQADGSTRAGDNWQKGIPLDAYMKSGFRHFMDWWHSHRRRGGSRVPTPAEESAREEAMCALMFNVMGYLHETLKQRDGAITLTNCRVIVP